MLSKMVAIAAWGYRYEHYLEYFTYSCITKYICYCNLQVETIAGPGRRGHLSQAGLTHYLGLSRILH